MRIIKLIMVLLGAIIISACSSQPPANGLGTATPPPIPANTQMPKQPSDQPPSPLPIEDVTDTPSPSPTLTVTQSATGTLTLTPTTWIDLPASDAIIIDHTSIELFDRIPEQYLTAARNLRMVYADRSVGDNINESLDCLAAASWSSSAPSCRRDYYGKDGSTWLFKTFTQADYQNNLVPARILFTPDPIKYNRSNWEFVFQMGEWDSLVEQFVNSIVPTYIDSKDVLSFQFTYLNVQEGSSIDDPDVGFFSDQPRHGFYPNSERWDISDLEELESQYPNKVFFYWTTSLARSIGSPDSTNFNNQMRQYALTNNKILFDVADIQSHDDRGHPCYDNRDGVEFCGTNGCENYADDHYNYPAICQDYTTETGGGHLGSVSAGRIRLAKAYWVLMARIAGWDGQAP